MANDSRQHFLDVSAVAVGIHDRLANGFAYHRLVHSDLECPLVVPFLHVIQEELIAAYDEIITHHADRMLAAGVPLSVFRASMDLLYETYEGIMDIIRCDEALRISRQLLRFLRASNLL